MAMAAIRVERQLRMKSSTMSAAQKPPSTRCSCTALNDSSMKVDWSRV